MGVATAPSPPMCPRHFAWIKEEVEEEERSNFLRLNEPSIAVTTSWSSLSAQLIKWDQLCLAQAMGPASVELLAAGSDDYVNQAKRAEEPCPNV